MKSFERLRFMEKLNLHLKDGLKIFVMEDFDYMLIYLVS